MTCIFLVLVEKNKIHEEETLKKWNNKSSEDRE
jgi:hypothetical protein